MLYSHVDEVKIYNRVVSESEMLKRYAVEGGFRLSAAGMGLKSATILDLQGRTLLTLNPRLPQGDIVLPGSFVATGQMRIQAVSESGRTLGGLFNFGR